MFSAYCTKWRINILNLVYRLSRAKTFLFFVCAIFPKLFFEFAFSSSANVSLLLPCSRRNIVAGIRLPLSCPQQRYAVVKPALGLECLLGAETAFKQVGSNIWVQILLFQDQFFFTLMSLELELFPNRTKTDIRAGQADDLVSGLEC